ncbi:hypothetical protein J3Q64DRAFT_1773410 [Phycomyces blakesleeanus]|uniref:LIM zinc-binding domain-containing protein n=1 Tax=Phycomyces blakesleeanus TaxID=4837 RepID=A0ABR3AJF0_PHYBL
MPPRFGGAPKCPRCQKAVYMAEQVIGPGGPWHSNCLTCKECNKRLDSSLSERDGEVYCKVCYTRQWGPKGYGFAGGAAFLSTETKLPSEILNESRHTSNHSPVTASSPTISSPTPPTLPSTRPSMQPPSIPSTRPPATPPTLPPRISGSPIPSPKLPERQINSTDPASPTDEPGSPESEDSDWSNPRPPPSLPKKPETFTPEQNRSIGTHKTSYINHTTGYVPRKVGFAIQNDTCTKCGKSVYAAELALGAGNKYHKLCLKCCECGKLLSSTNMVDRDSDLYCRGCYSRSFGPKGYGFGNLLTPEGATR